MAKNSLYRSDPNKRPWGIQGMPGFLLVCIGQIVSLIGSGMTCFADSVWVYTDRGASITNLAVLAFVSQMPGVLISPIAGVIVDRYDRRKIMIVCNALAALVTLYMQSIVVASNKDFAIWKLYLVVIALSTINHFQWPAFFATVPTIVPKEHLGSANGLVQLARSIGQVAAPFMAAIAISLWKIQGVILFDMVSYTIALFTLLIVWIPNPVATARRRGKPVSFKDEFVAGWRYLFKQTGLMRLLGLIAVNNMALGMISILLLPLALTVTTTAMYGTLASLGGVSMFMSSLVLGLWGGPKRRTLGVLLFMLLQGVAIVIGGMRPSLTNFLIATVLFYFAAPIVNACAGIIWQTKVPPEMQGRALAATVMVSTGALQLGYLISGYSIDYVFKPFLESGTSIATAVLNAIGTGTARELGLAYVVVGLALALLSIAGLANRNIRELDMHMPDAIPDKPMTKELQTQLTALRADPYSVN
jgi:MFS transporter, DHA3 family, macrolide efflux protein